MQLNKNLFINFTWLATSQGANFIVPLVVYPYLVRVIGIEKFGLVILAQAAVTYFAHIVDYGFSITAVRQVSIYRNDPARLSQVFNTLYLTKFLICAPCFVLLAVLTWLIPEWHTHRFLFLSSFSIVIGQLFLPIWFFQGLEKMNGVAAMNFITKASFTLLILLFVNQPSDYFLANFYLGVSQMGVGLIAAIFIVNKYHLTPQIEPVRIIKEKLKENRSIFLSGFAVFASSNSNLLVLGMIADPVSVGYYGIVDKILLAARAPAVLLYQTIFPRVCALAEHSFEGVRGFLKKVTRLIYLVFIPLGICILLFSDQIIRVFAGGYLAEPGYLLCIVCFVPLLAAVGIPATHTLLAYDLKRTYAQVTTSAAVLNVVLNILLAHLLGAEGTAITALVTELFISSTLFICLATYHRKYNVLTILNPF